MSKYAQFLIVQYGGVSVGDHTASVAFSFDRDKLAPARADEMLCGKRLEVFVCVGTEPDPDQQTLPNVEDNRPIVRATADSPRLGMSPKKWAGRLTFSLEEINPAKLIGLAKRTGSVMFNVLGPIPEKEPAGDGEAAESNGAPRLPMADEPKRVRRDEFAATPIEDLLKFKDGDGKPYLTKAKCEALRESGLDIGTVGRLETVIRTERDWPSKVRGLGKAWVDRVTNALLAFRLEHPVPGPDDHEDDIVTEATREDDDEDIVARPDPDPANDPVGAVLDDIADDCSIEGAVSRRIVDSTGGAEWAVTVHTATGRDGKFRSCYYAVRGNTIEGREIPAESSTPYDGEVEAAVAAAHAIAGAMVGWRRSAAQEVEKWAQRISIGSAKFEEVAREEVGSAPIAGPGESLPDVVPFVKT